jgi:hypothetical protein
VERAAGDEQDVVGLHHAVLGGDGRTFHQRQQVALHALTGYVRTAAVRAGGDLVDLVEKHDAVLFDGKQRLLLHFLFIDQPRSLFVGQHAQGFVDGILRLRRR